MALFNKSKKKKDEIYFGIRLNISAPFPRPITYPKLEHLIKYLADVTDGIVSINAEKYEKTFSSPSLPLLPYEPRRFYTNTRTSKVKITITDSRHSNDLILDVKEKMEEQRVVFTGIEFILDNPDLPPLTEKQNEFLMFVKRSIAEYFQTYKS